MCCEGLDAGIEVADLRDRLETAEAMLASAQRTIKNQAKQLNEQAEPLRAEIAELERRAKNQKDIIFDLSRRVNPPTPDHRKFSPGDPIPPPSEAFKAIVKKAGAPANAVQAAALFEKASEMIQNQWEVKPLDPLIETTSFGDPGRTFLPYEQQLGAYAFVRDWRMEHAPNAVVSLKATLEFDGNLSQSLINALHKARRVRVEPE